MINDEYYPFFYKHHLTHYQQLLTSSDFVSHLLQLTCPLDSEHYIYLQVT